MEKKKPREIKEKVIPNSGWLHPKVFYLILVFAAVLAASFDSLRENDASIFYFRIFDFSLAKRREQIGSTHVDDLLEDGPWASRKLGVLRVYRDWGWWSVKTLDVRRS